MLRRLLAAPAGPATGNVRNEHLCPAAGKPTFELGDDEMEIGIGIHGEPGRQRVKLASAAEVTEMLANPVIEDLGLKAGERVRPFSRSSRSSRSFPSLPGWTTRLLVRIAGDALPRSKSVPSRKR